MKIHKICVLGGTGFVGRHLVSELTRRGYQTRVLTRRRERHRELLVFPTLKLVETRIHDVSALRAAFEGCDAVINLVGILNEGKKTGERFRTVHVELPRKVAEACHNIHVPRLLHMSALNADRKGPSEYLRTKGEGEEAVHAADGDDLHVTSFRPSVIFGPDDDFFNRFASLLAHVPLIFPLACPAARFAPVYVEDVVRAFANALVDKKTFGQRYDLCGPHAYRLRELLEYTARAAGLHRSIIGLSDNLSRRQARLLELAPGKPFSRDNYLSMQVDSTCVENGFATLGITPTSIDAVVPTFLGHQDKNAFYSRLRSAAGRD